MNLFGIFLVLVVTDCRPGFSTSTFPRVFILKSMGATMSRFVKRLNKYTIATTIYVFFGLSLLAVSEGTSIAATATTKDVTDIAYSTATGNGSVVSSFYVTAYGVSGIRPERLHWQTPAPTRGAHSQVLIFHRQCLT